MLQHFKNNRWPLQHHLQPWQIPAQGCAVSGSREKCHVSKPDTYRHGATSATTCTTTRRSFFFEWRPWLGKDTMQGHAVKKRGEWCHGHCDGLRRYWAQVGSYGPSVNSTCGYCSALQCPSRFRIWKSPEVIVTCVSSWVGSSPPYRYKYMGRCILWDGATIIQGNPNPLSLPLLPAAMATPPSLMPDSCGMLVLLLPLPSL